MHLRDPTGSGTPPGLQVSPILDAAACIYLTLPACFISRFHEIGPSNSAVS